MSKCWYGIEYEWYTLATYGVLFPIEFLNRSGQTPLPAAFLRFIGVMESLGGLGLLLPGTLRIRTELTALASPGFVII